MQVCWECYDFEAAAAHEIGHLLGLSHPDSGASELAPGYRTTGNNTYHSLLAAGTVMNASTCTNPWHDVSPGVPEGVATTKAGVRPSLMESFTTHNPSVCLTQDDYEGLLSLYPVCEGMPPGPQCVKSAVNIGYMRVTVFLLCPFIFSLLLSILIHFCVDKQEEAESRGERLGKAIQRSSISVSRPGSPGSVKAARVAPHDTATSSTSSKSAYTAPDAAGGTAPKALTTAPTESEQAAAARIQAAKRGNADRSRVASMRQQAQTDGVVVTADEGAGALAADEGAGAGALAAAAAAPGGDVGAVEAAAATRLQAAKRGKNDRAKVAAMRTEQGA